LCMGIYGAPGRFYRMSNAGLIADAGA